MKYIIIPICITAIVLYLINWIFTRRKILDEGNEVLSFILSTAFKVEDLSEASGLIFKSLKTRFNIDYCSIFTYEKSRNELNIIYSNIETKYTADIEAFSSELFNDMTSKGDVASRRQSSNAVLEYTSAAERQVKYYYFALLKLDNSEIVGAILIENKDDKKSEKFESNFFKVARQCISMVLNSFLENQKKQYIDGLTGAYNRKFMDKYLQSKINEYKRFNKNFSLAILDVDHFKSVNDTWGHIVGDEVLRQVSSFIQSNIRQNIDMFFRAGGEEFILLFKDLPIGEAYNRLDDMRQKLSQLKIKRDNTNHIFVTASFGLSEFPSDSIELKQLIDCADKALYRAKKSGRNQVRIYNE